METTVKDLDTETEGMDALIEAVDAVAHDEAKLREVWRFLHICAQLSPGDLQYFLSLNNSAVVQIAA